MNRMVSFRRMEDGTRDDYLLLDQSERNYAVGLADRVLEALRKLDHSLEGYPVSRLGHSLQRQRGLLRMAPMKSCWSRPSFTMSAMSSPPTIMPRSQRPSCGLMCALK